MADEPRYSKIDLLARHIGEYADPTHPATQKKWFKKRTTYCNEGVDLDFRKLKNSLLIVLRTHEDCDPRDPAHKTAQLIMDTFLLRRANGDKVSIPTGVVIQYDGKDAVKSKDELVDPKIFEGKKEVSENEKLRWVYESMKLEDVRPEDAPSAGAWGMYEHYRYSPQRLEKFYDTLVPKLMSKEDTDKGGKLADDGKEAIELIERLQAALPEEEA